MSGFNTSAADAAVVTLRIMRRLLQDEEMTLSQLNYLIENIHDPLAQACLPPSQRPIVPALSPATPQASSRAGSATRSFSSSALARLLALPDAEGGKRELRQSPQPAVVGAVAKTATAASPPITAKRDAARRKALKSSTPPPPLTFSQYWDLFANLPTLYAVHMTLVQQLEGIVQRLLFMVEELQPSRDAADFAAATVTSLAEDGGGAAGVLTHNHSPPNFTSPDGHGATATTTSAGAGGHGSGSNRKHISALRFPTAAGILQGNRGVVGEIGVMVHEFFGSELMKHFMAEHMMYTMKYTQRAAPQLLRLSRVWRWIGGGSGETSGVSAAALASLADADRTMLLQHGQFLDFLWRSFGPSGIPQDGRVCLLPPLESSFATGQLQTPTPADQASVALATAEAAASGATTANHNTVAVNGAGGVKRARATPAGGTAATAASPTRSALPPIPLMWEGFRTILALLATPLGGLRRYSHVARCLVESGALQPKDRDRVQESFIDVIALRMSEETNLVMEELWTHDVAGIMALMDMPGSRAAGEKTGALTAPRRAGVVGAGSGSGTHNGHTVAQDSVGGSGGAAVTAAAVAGAGSAGGVSPASSAIGVSNAYLPSPDCSNRALIHYGRLIKRFGRGRHERLTFLFSDWMCYVEECSSGRFRVRGTIPLPNLRVVEVRDEEASDAMHGFELLSPHLPKRLIFFTSSPEQRGQWVDAIRYTVKRFCDQHGPKRGTSALATAVTNSSVIAPAVTVGETGLPSVMRATAPMLSSTSRLNRQRRYDAVWQDYVDVQRRMTEALTQTSPMLPGMSSASLGGTMGGGPGVGFGSASSNGHSPPPPGNLSGDVSRDSSFAGQRSSSTHRQLEYDVTPWSQHASVHRRIRSQDLLAAHQQQQQQQQQQQHGAATTTVTTTAATSSSSYTVSPTHSAGTRMNASLSAGPEDVEKTLALPGSGGDTSTIEGAASLPCLADEGRASATQLPTPLLLSPGGSPGKSFNRRRSSSLRPAFLDTIGSGSNRVGGGGGLSTPLRRPVSERFEAVKNMGSGNAVASQSQQQQPSLHRASSSSFSTSRNPSAGVLAADAALPRAATTLPPTPGTAAKTNASSPTPPPAAAVSASAAGSRGHEENADVPSCGRDGDTVSPPPRDPAGDATEREVEGGDASAVVLEDSTSEVSDPVEGDAAVASDDDEEDAENDSGTPLGGRGAKPQPLYSDVLDLTTRHEDEREEEEGEESSHIEDACSNELSHGPSTGELDRLIAGSSSDATANRAGPLEAYDDDLHDNSEPPQEPQTSRNAVDVSLAASDKTGSASALLASPMPGSHNDAARRQSTDYKLTGEDVSLSASGLEKLRRSGVLEKAGEEEDTVTAVVTAFRRNSSPARSVMSPISPVHSYTQPPLMLQDPRQEEQQQQQDPQQASSLDESRGGADGTVALAGAVLTASTEQNSASQSVVPVSEKSLLTMKDEDSGQRRRHVDPMASDGSPPQRS